MVEPMRGMWLRVVLLAAGIAAQPAHAQLDQLMGSRDPKVVLVYVDLTQSIKGADIDRIYTPTLRSLMESLQPGDRLVLAEISEQTLGNFAPAADVPFPVTGRSMDDTDALDAGKKKLRDQWRKLTAQRGKAKATVIVDSMGAAAQIFARDPRKRKWLLILSDMVEESKVANFAKAVPDAAATDALLRERRGKGLMPDLKGVQVFVAGAAAPGAEQYTAIQDFWLEYFRAAGAQVSEKTYGRVALTFR
jgi:hypothetical protein